MLLPNIMTRRLLLAGTSRFGIPSKVGAVSPLTRRVLDPTGAAGKVVSTSTNACVLVAIPLSRALELLSVRLQVPPSDYIARLDAIIRNNFSSRSHPCSHRDEQRQFPEITKELDVYGVSSLADT